VIFDGEKQSVFTFRAMKPFFVLLLVLMFFLEVDLGDLFLV